MGMSDIYHWTRWHVCGSFDPEAVNAAVTSAWDQAGAVNHEAASGPLDRIWISTFPLGATGRALELLGAPSDATLSCNTEAPRDDAARAVWGPATGLVVDELLAEPGVKAWVLMSGEDHIVGAWQRERSATINTLISGEGFTMRGPLALMLMERFENHGVTYTLEDLGGSTLV